MQFAGASEPNEKFSLADRAAYLGDLEQVVSYIESGHDPNAFSICGSTMLMSAATNGHVEVVRFLLQHGADPNRVDEDGRCALYSALSAKDAGAYEILHPITAERLRQQADRDKERQRKSGFLKW